MVSIFASSFVNNKFPDFFELWIGGNNFINWLMMHGNRFHEPGLLDVSTANLSKVNYQILKHDRLSIPKTQYWQEWVRIEENRVENQVETAITPSALMSKIAEQVENVNYLNCAVEYND